MLCLPVVSTIQEMNSCHQELELLERWFLVAAMLTVGISKAAASTRPRTVLRIWSLPDDEDAVMAAVVKLKLGRNFLALYSAWRSRSVTTASGGELRKRTGMHWERMRDVRKKHLPKYGEISCEGVLYLLGTPGSTFRSLRWPLSCQLEGGLSIPSLPAQHPCGLSALDTGTHGMLGRPSSSTAAELLSEACRQILVCSMSSLQAPI